MDGIIYIENFISKPDELFDFLRDSIEWDDRMSARKTASYGMAYNYSQMSYPFQAFIPELEEIWLFRSNRASDFGDMVPL